MITEDYVSFETAKLLKEKGFDWECKTRKFYPEPEYDAESPNGVYAPTIHMAMKWLRETHKMFIQVELYSKYENYCFELFQNTHRLMVEHREVYNSYEEACEAAIKYCLKNLM